MNSPKVIKRAACSGIVCATRNKASSGHRRRGLPVTIAAASLALAIAACGSSSSKPTSSANPLFAISQCMRAHGVPDFPDPTKGPTGSPGLSVNTSPGGVTSVNGIVLSGPAFEAAVKTCKLFGGGSGPPPNSHSQQLAQLHFAQCMRKHGVPNYPDPRSSGGHLSISKSPALVDSPAGKQAVAACNTALGLGGAG